MKAEIRSGLEKVIQQAWAEKNLDLAKKMVVDFLQESKIKDEDKKKMIYVIQTEIKNKYKFDYYLTNALLKFEGMSIYGHEIK